MLKLNQEVLNKALDIYGDKQLIVAIEEMSELQKEICKCLRGTYNYLNILEEIADVCIMVKQLLIKFGISEDALQGVINYKINRLEARLNE